MRSIHRCALPLRCRYLCFRNGPSVEGRSTPLPQADPVDHFCVFSLDSNRSIPLQRIRFFSAPPVSVRFFFREWTMELNLNGRVAIITGGSSGIGRKICHTYAKAGVHPVIFARNRAKGEKTLGECSALGTEGLFVAGDCSVPEHCRRAVDETIVQWGKVDILVHNAAPHTDGAAIMPLLLQNGQQWADFVNVILWGAIYSTRAVLPHMFKNNHGRLIYICSDAGRTGDAFQPVYAACKAALVGFMKSMARYGGNKNVLANVVSPALTLTDENRSMLERCYGAGTESGMKRLCNAYPTGRLAQAQDMANMVVFLSSARADDVTGQVVGVNGGYFMPST